MREQPRHFHPEPYAYHTELELTVEALTNLGQGVARDDGWVVLVPFALPGERIRARIFRNKPNYSEADLVEVLEASPHRVEPKCSLFGTCGGCQYQHVDYEEQLRNKTEAVRELLERQADVQVEVRPAHGSPRIYGYRAKLTPHFQKPQPGKPRPIGFLRNDSRRILDVPQCPIATDAINEVLPDARAEVLAGHGKVYRKGGTLLLRETSDGVIRDMAALATDRLLGKVFQYKAGEFFQNNLFILPDMVTLALDEAAKPGIRYLVDAYCGVGVFSLCGADRFERFAGVEVSAEAIKWANVNASLNGVTNGDFLIGKAEAIFAKVTFPSDETAVLLDPPRRGCDQLFLDQLLACKPRRIVYVSCDPATQARDLKVLLAGGYEINVVQPFDLFPHTRHIENVVSLERV